MVALANYALSCRRVVYAKIINSTRAFSVSRALSQKPYYVTSPIFYPNAAPHIGHLYTLVTADIFARHARLRRPGTPAYFLAGTDEHGFKIQKAALARDLDPAAFCDELSAHFRKLTERTNASHTRFVRTTEPDHQTAVEHVWRELDAKGLIYKGSHQGWYSISDECFYPESQVTRKKAPYTMGKQQSFVSIETGSAVEWMEEENYMFRLSAFQDSLLERYKSEPLSIYPPTQHADVIDMLSQPLEDLSISRPRARLHWGIPVPTDPTHTIYVWFDALTVYLTGAGFPGIKSEANLPQVGWPPDLQVIGKDILRFHAIYFPAMLQALGLPLPKQILSHAHWTVNRQKMSKSIGNVADPFKAMDELGVDLVRYYLARVGGRFKDDVDWSQEQLEKHAFELQSLLGNFYLRVTSKAIQKRLSPNCHARFAVLIDESTKVPALHEAVNSLQSLSQRVDENLQLLQVADALDAIVQQLLMINQMLTVTQPWSKETTSELTEQVYAVSIETLRICGLLLQPFIPSKSEELLDALGVPKNMRTWNQAQLGGGSVGDVQRGVRLFTLPAKSSPASGS